MVLDIMPDGLGHRVRDPKETVGHVAEVISRRVSIYLKECRSMDFAHRPCVFLY